MTKQNLFEPFSPVTMGDLETYLIEHERISESDVFYGAEKFFQLKDKGLIVPLRTSLIVLHSYAEDHSYFVNEDFLLQRGSYEMSHISVMKETYYPSVVLKNNNWSISGPMIR
jgi:hypothetical protein